MLEMESPSEFRSKTVNQLVKNVVDEVESQGTNLDVAVGQVLDRDMMWNEDLLAAVLYYGKVSEAYQLVYDELYGDVYELAEDALEDGNKRIGE